MKNMLGSTVWGRSWLGTRNTVDPDLGIFPQGWRFKSLSLVPLVRVCVFVFSDSAFGYAKIGEPENTNTHTAAQWVTHTNGASDCALNVLYILQTSMHV